MLYWMTLAKVSSNQDNIVLQENPYYINKTYIMH